MIFGNPYLKGYVTKYTRKSRQTPAGTNGGTYAVAATQIPLTMTDLDWDDNGGTITVDGSGFHILPRGTWQVRACSTCFNTGRSFIRLVGLNVGSQQGMSYATDLGASLLAFGTFVSDGVNRGVRLDFFGSLAEPNDYALGPGHNVGGIKNIYSVLEFFKVAD